MTVNSSTMCLDGRYAPSVEKCYNTYFVRIREIQNWGPVFFNENVLG